MPCYSPLKAYRLEGGGVSFTEHAKARILGPLSLPCGQCIGCRLERSRQWAVRCVHESKMHEQNCFLTLTYNDENLPSRDSLDYRDYQLFMKKLRKYAASIGVKTVRFYMCGEYGPENGRPHYHACIFGFNFPDRRPLRLLDSGCRLFRSNILDSLWGKGHASIGDVTFESAAYVARYCVQKITGHMSKQAYSRVDVDTGEIYEIEPEFNQMSLKPGIGATWLEKYASDVYQGDEVIVRGKRCKPPRYYDKKLDGIIHARQLQNEVERELHAYENREDNTPDRLQVKEFIAKQNFNRYQRKEL